MREGRADWGSMAIRQGRADWGSMAMRGLKKLPKSRRSCALSEDLAGVHF